MCRPPTTVAAPVWRGRGYVVGVDEDVDGRVSDPGRYAGLHVAMDSLL